MTSKSASDTLQDHLNLQTLLLQETFEHAPVGILHVDSKGKVINANPELMCMVRDHIQWHAKTRFYELIYHKDFQVVLESFDGLVQGRTDKIELDCRLNRGIADHIWVHLSASKMTVNKNGNYFLFVIKDISEMKKAETELLAINAQLDNFVYRASHDLKSPLTTILGLSNLAIHAQDMAEAKEMFALVKDTAEKMVLMLQQLSSAGKIKHSLIQVEKVAFGQLLKDIKAQMSFQKGFEDFQIIAEIEEFYDFYSDSLLVRTIIQNLIENAFKYRRAGEPNTYCKVICQRKIDGVNILIEDNGQGIDAPHQDRLFDMFYRANAQASGTGLGLFMVKIAVERLKGEIQMISTPHVGTTVYVFLPDSVMPEK